MVASALALGPHVAVKPAVGQVGHGLALGSEPTGRDPARRVCFLHDLRIERALLADESLPVERRIDYAAAVWTIRQFIALHQGEQAGLN